MVDRPVGHGPCLGCGNVGTLGPGRDLSPFPVYCIACTAVERPRAISPSLERHLSMVDLDVRGITDPAGYRRRNR